jgi:hypothetical protein
MHLIFRCFLATLLIIIWGCNEFKPDSNYLQKYSWSGVRTTQYLQFTNDSIGMMMIPNREGTMDTFPMTYNFEPDSALMQLDLAFFTPPLKGLHLYGVIEFIHQDTFLYYTEKGFPEMGQKYRPNRMDYVKAVPFVKEKK